MSMLANLPPLVDAQGVAFNDSQAGKGSFKLGKGGEAPPVPLDRDDIGSGIEQGPGQAAGPGAYLIDRLSFQWTRKTSLNSSDRFGSAPMLAR